MSNLEQFDLEKQIAEWRQTLLASKTIDREEAAELEDHMRQEIERLAALGIPESEAFTTAMQNVGAVDVLAAEYGKADPLALWSKRLQWALPGYLSITRARPIKLWQPVGLCGVGAIIALIFNNSGFFFPNYGEATYLSWWHIALYLTGLEALNQILAMRFAGRVTLRRESSRIHAANVLVNIFCFLLPPLGLIIWLVTDHKSPQKARRAFRSSVRGGLVALIIMEYALVYFLVNIAISAIADARLTPIDPVRAERKILQKKLLRQQQRGQRLPVDGVLWRP